MTSQRSSYLLVISGREALTWILTSQRMAFPGIRSRSASLLRPGDDLLLYATRQCFRSPGRNQSRVIGHAMVSSAVTVLDTAVKFDGRTFPVGCSLNLDVLAPFGNGLELANYVTQMHAFPNKGVWHVSRLSQF